MPRHKKQSNKRKKKSSTSSFFKRLNFFKSGWIILIPLILAGIAATTATQLEDHDSFCASCHTEPETAYFKREAGSTPVDLASFHATKSVRCIDCHSGKGLFGRVSAWEQGGQDLVAFVSGHYKQPAPLTNPIPDANCVKCHADVFQRQDFNNHFHVFLPQWQAQDPNAATCVACHQSHPTNGEPKTAFLNESTTTQVCQRCHAFAGQG